MLQPLFPGYHGPNVFLGKSTASDVSSGLCCIVRERLLGKGSGSSPPPPRLPLPPELCNLQSSGADDPAQK